jgi:hypothetical protein
MWFGSSAPVYRVKSEPLLRLNLLNKSLVKIRLDLLLKAEGEAGVLVMAILGPCRRKVAAADCIRK